VGKMRTWSATLVRVLPVDGPHVRILPVAYFPKFSLPLSSDKTLYKHII